MKSEYPTKDGAGNTIIAAELGNGPVLEVAGQFVAVGDSAPVISQAGNGVSVNAHFVVWGVFDATVNWQKSYDNGVTWITMFTCTAPDDQIYVETEQGVQFRVDCSAFTSGTINYRISTK